MSTERMRKHLAKLNLPGNEDLKEIFLQKQREKSNRYRKRMLSNKKSAEKYRKAQAKKVQKHREKKRASEALSGYKSKHSICRTAAKIKKILPQDKKKQTEVLSYLLTKVSANDPRLLPLPPLPSPKQTSLRPIDVAVKEFFNLDSVSSILPRTKDVVQVKQEDGSKKTERKRILKETLLVTHRKFLELNPDAKMSLSKFKELRPRHVLPFRKFRCPTNSKI